jgi:hypothetical protein
MQTWHMVSMFLAVRALPLPDPIMSTAWERCSRCMVQQRAYIMKARGGVEVCGAARVQARSNWLLLAGFFVLQHQLLQMLLLL